MWILVTQALCLTVAIVMTVSPPTLTVLETIGYWNRLRKVSTLIQLHNLTHYYERSDITVFVPTTSSYDKFVTEAAKFGYQTSNPQTMEEFLLYHIADGVVRVADMHNMTSIRSMHPANKLLFFNTFSYGDTQVYSVNGAWVVTSDIRARNGIIHIIDRFISPIQNTKTIAQFLEFPDVTELAFVSISMASIVDGELKHNTNLVTKRYTVFAPNDSFITGMQEYGKDKLFNDWTLLKSVYWAHVVTEDVIFIPRLGELPNLAAKAGVIRFYRVGNEVFVSNGLVRARVVEPNIPVANGVVHVIDDLLFFVYMNVKQKIQNIPNVQFINNTLHKLASELQTKLEDPDRQMTLFLPTDDAFAKLPVDNQMALDKNETHLTKMMEDHLIIYTKREIYSFQDGETFAASDGRILTIHKVNKDIYVEGGNIQARVTVPDLGCTNGIIHLISNVLFQREFTIWDAIQGNSQLSKMAEFIEIMDGDLLEALVTSDNGPMTVFLISDAAFNRLPPDTLHDLRSNPDKLLQAVKGSVAHGVILSSTQVGDEVEVPTMTGHRITIHSTKAGMYVIGSHIRANVVIRDIWCSNGMLHITDNVLHLPTRNIVDEIGRQPALSVFSGILRAYPNVSSDLSSPDRLFTMFVPNDDAFTYMPTNRAKALKPEWLKRIVKAHVIGGTSKYVEEFGDYTSFKTEEGGTLFIVKTDHKAYAATNNVKGDIVEDNIRCTNGMIHIVDTLLYFPFFSVAETMRQTSELLPFYSLLEKIDEFQSWASSDGIDQTVFVPSAAFLTQLDKYHKTAIDVEPGLIRKIYEGHFLPGKTLNERFMEMSFLQTRVYLTESRYNSTFTLIDKDTPDKTEMCTIDVGFTNLRRSIDLVKDGIGCSNGVIYVMDGFLNYPIYNIPDEIKRQPNISIGTDQLLKLVPANSTIDLGSKNTLYTLFAPSDDAFKHFTYDDITYINNNITYNESLQVIGRHIVKGNKVTYDDMLNGEFVYYADDHDMQIILRTDGLYLKWNNIEAKIVTPNILATNGIIHVVDRMLLSTPYQTTAPPTTVKATRSHVSSAQTIQFDWLLLLVLLSLEFIVKHHLVNR